MPTASKKAPSTIFARVEEDLATRTRTYAAANNSSLAEVVSAALRLYLRRNAGRMPIMPSAHRD